LPTSNFSPNQVTPSIPDFSRNISMA